MDRLVDKAVDLGSADPHLDERDDILALMLQARYDDGSAMGRREIADQLLTLLAAGHETTATTLAWAVERLRRHPDLLAALVNEADAEAHAGGSALREATILEVQRTRPVLTAALRRARTRIRLGEWVIPEDDTILVSTQLAGTGRGGNRPGSATDGTGLAGNGRDP